jgi:hypothetical protein
MSLALGPGSGAIHQDLLHSGHRSEIINVPVPCFSFLEMALKARDEPPLGTAGVDVIT